MTRFGLVGGKGAEGIKESVCVGLHGQRMRGSGWVWMWMGRKSSRVCVGVDVGEQ